jgi:hypothetical protein
MYAADIANLAHGSNRFEKQALDPTEVVDLQIRSSITTAQAAQTMGVDQSRVFDGIKPYNRRT